MKYYLLKTILLLLSNLAFSSADQQALRFPEIKLINCNHAYRSDEAILQCETMNFKHAEEAVTQFFPKLYTFVPENYQATLDQAQIYWKDLIYSECQLLTLASDSAESPAKMLNCLTERYQQRLSDLIYAFILWNNKLNYYEQPKTPLSPSD